jgi:hypothetical protein
MVVRSFDDGAFTPESATSYVGGGRSRAGLLRHSRYCDGERAAIAAAAAPGVCGARGGSPKASVRGSARRRPYDLPREIDRKWRQRRSGVRASNVGRGVRDRRAGPDVIDHGVRRRHCESAGPPASRLRIRARARRLCPPDCRAAWPSDAPRQGRGNRNRTRLRLPDAGPHRRRED